jgi:hypothetical protein
VEPISCANCEIHNRVHGAKCAILFIALQLGNNPDNSRYAEGSFICPNYVETEKG